MGYTPKPPPVRGWRAVLSTLGAWLVLIGVGAFITYVGWFWSGGCEKMIAPSECPWAILTAPFVQAGDP